MRMTAPAIGGAAIVLAVALVWFLQPTRERRLAPELESIAPSKQPAETSPPAVSDAALGAVPTPDASSADAAGDAAPTPERSPLPGEAPTAPMAQALTDFQQSLRNRDAEPAIPPSQFIEGEREFAAEPIDGTWAPSAEASLLATIAEVAGLELVDLQVQCRSTMCRVQLTQPMAARPGAKPPFKIAEQVDMKPRWVISVIDGGAPERPPQIGDPPLPLKSIAYFWRDGFAPQQPETVPPPVPVRSGDL
jgi:hypothetical protein